MFRPSCLGPQIINDSIASCLEILCFVAEIEFILAARSQLFLISFPFPFVPHQSHSLYRWVIPALGSSGRLRHSSFEGPLPLCRSRFLCRGAPLAILLTVETRTPIRLRSLYNLIIEFQKVTNSRRTVNWLESEFLETYFISCGVTGL